MDKKKNTLLIVSISLICIGAAMAIGGFMGGGFRPIIGGINGFKIYDSESIIKEQNNLEKFNDIDIDIRFADIELIKGDKYYIEVEYNKDIEDLRYSVQNNKLTLSSESIDMFFNMEFINRKANVKIYIPEEESISNLNVKNNSGNLVCSNMNINTSDIECDFGDVSIDGVTGNEIKVEAKSGEVNIKNINTEKLELFVDFGDIVANNINTTQFNSELKSGSIEADQFTANSARIDSDFGDIEGSKFVTNGLVIKSKSGKVKIDGEIKGKNIIDADFGDINIKTTLAKSEYEYDLDMDFGTSIIDGQKSKESVMLQNTDANNKFIINCKSGDLKIDFIK